MRKVCRIALIVGLSLLATGCEPPPAPVAQPSPPPPPPPVAAAPAKPAPVTLPPELIAKVDELTAIYKDMQQQAAAPADPNDLEGLEKRLKSVGEFAGKTQKVLTEIAAEKAKLTPEQAEKFRVEYESKLIPPTLPVPVTPSLNP